MFSQLLSKILGVYVLLRHYSVKPEYRYYYKDTYRCRLVQWKYFFKDYFFKKPYKVLSFQGEFAPELQFVLPFAYWHYKNGTLKATVSSSFTSELYFFSPQHEERFSSRSNEGNYNEEMPRILYSQDYHMSKWEPVPLKAQYRNDIYVYGKPMVIIANRFNMEWDGPPVSYFDIPMLDFLFNRLKESYTIVYNRPRPADITMDNSEVYDLDEFDWIREYHPEVLLMEDLFAENKGGARNFNHLQLLVYANADRFISIHGGTATLASYFGGINIILSKKGPEHHFKCFEKLYPQFSGAKILHASTDEALKTYVNDFYLHPIPSF